MLKEGAFRAFRNLPIGWVTHANHARDLSERLFHHAVEGGLIALVGGVACLLNPQRNPVCVVAVSAFIVHTLWWVIDGNFHVCLLDSFKFVRNAGLQAVLAYIAWTRDVFLKSGQVDAILVYGSFCRAKFHGRSDLDLRILRKRGFYPVLCVMPLAVVARAVSFFRGIPTDLQVVDSEEFLLRQMRADEHPVCVYDGGRLVKIRVGLRFEDVVARPEIILKR